MSDRAGDVVVPPLEYGRIAQLKGDFLEACAEAGATAYLASVAWFAAESVLWRRDDEVFEVCGYYG